MSRASAAMAPPSACDPVSPMMIRAGAVFHHRKPRVAAVSAADSMARSRAPETP